MNDDFGFQHGVEPEGQNTDYKQKHSRLLSTIIIPLAAFILGGIFTFYIVTDRVQETEVVTDVVEEIDWIIYESKFHKITLEYPEGWIIEEDKTHISLDRGGEAQRVGDQYLVIATIAPEILREMPSWQRESLFEVSNHSNEEIDGAYASREESIYRYDDGKAGIIQYQFLVNSKYYSFLTRYISETDYIGERIVSSVKFLDKGDGVDLDKPFFLLPYGE